MFGKHLVTVGLLDGIVLGSELGLSDGKLLDDGSLIGQCDGSP